MNDLKGVGIKMELLKSRLLLTPALSKLEIEFVNENLKQLISCIDREPALCPKEYYTFVTETIHRISVNASMDILMVLQKSLMWFISLQDGDSCFCSHQLSSIF